MRPLEALRAVAQRIGDGDFTLATPVTGLSELDQLGDSLRSSANRIGRLLTRNVESILKSDEGQTFTVHHHEAVHALRKRNAFNVTIRELAAMPTAASHGDITPATANGTMAA